ncbi:MAG: ABC transporter substrate-binding protein [Actinobacteria bacterium]|nr:ABC transporter substrate-binding protein [Actinomycetota bacterium]
MALLAAICLVGALCLAGCGGSSSTSGSSGGGGSSGSSGSAEPTSAEGSLATGKSNPNATLIVNVATPVATLDPSFTYADQEAGLAGTLYSTLTQPKREPGSVEGTEEQNLSVEGVEPYIAKSWAFSNGKRTLTFKIRPGLKFPSGDPLDANAVKWSLERTLTSESGGYSVLEETDFKPPLIKSIEAPDATTLVINYKRPAPNQLQVLSTPTAGAIYDPKLVEEHGGQKPATPNEWLASHSAGDGPYLLKSYQANREIVLEANPEFFQQPKTKNVIIRFVPDNETLLLDAQSGQADVTLGLSGQAAKSLEGNSCCTVATFKSRQAQTLNFPINEEEPWKNENDPFFKNEKFRQALSYAFPYEAVLEKVGYGYGQLYNGEWMPAFSWYESGVGAPRETNVEKAKELLAQSGVKTPVNFTIYVSQGATVEKEIATAAAGAWEELGVHAKVQTTSPANFLEVVYTTHAGASVFLDGPQVVAPDYYWAYDLQCPPNNGFNDTNLCVPAADKAMKKVPYAKNEAELDALIKEANELWIEATPRIWVYNQQLVAVLGKSMTGYYSSDLPEVRWWSKE